MAKKPFLIIKLALLIFFSVFIFAGFGFVEASDGGVSDTQEVQEDESIDVLVMFSFELNNYSTKMKYEVILEQFSDIDNLNYYVEFYDSTKFKTEDYLVLKKEELEIKYQDQIPFDVILIFDEEAMSFAINYPFMAKVIYGGVVDEGLVDAFSYDVNASGFSEKMGFFQTTKAALKLYPNAKHVYFIFDNSYESNYLMNEITEAEDDYLKIGLHIHFLSSKDYSFGDVMEELDSFNENEIVIYHSFNNDVNDRYLNEANVREVFSEISSIPIFSVRMPSDGLLGGFVVDEYEEARMVTDYTLDYLFKENFEDNAQVYYRHYHDYVFDYEVLGLFGIEESDLPSKTILINANTTENTIGYMFLGTVAVSVAVLIIIFLVVQKQRASSFNRLVGIEDLNLRAKKLFGNHDEHDAFGEMLELLRSEFSAIAGFYVTFDIKTNEFEVFQATHADSVDLDQFFGSNRLYSNPDFLRSLHQQSAFVLRNPNVINYKASSIEDESVLVQSVLIVPIDYDDEQYHLMMLLSKDRNFYVSREQLKALDVLSNSISSILMNMRANEKQNELVRSFSLQRKELDYIVMNSSNLIIIFDYQNNKVEMNEKLRQLLGIEPELDNYMGLIYEKYVHPDDVHYQEKLKNYPEYFEKSENNQVNLRLRLKTAQYGYRWYDWNVFIFLEDGKVVRRISLGEDVTEELERDQQLTYLMTHDSLTELHNSTYIKEKLMNIEKGQHAFCAYINIDNFRMLNESFGHKTGDEFLILFGRRLKFSLSAIENLEVARVSGDEFAVLLMGEGKTFDDNVMKVKKILEEINFVPIECFGEPVSFNLSVGHASYPDVASEPIDIFRFAEMAMFESKEHNQNVLQVFDKKVIEKQMLMREITRDVQQALLRDEFEMFYQPIYDVKHPNKVYFESLMRWQHPEKGLLSPNYFLDVIEKNGQVVELSRLMFEKICRFIEKSRNNGFTINSISFNISVNSLRLRDEAQFYIDKMKEFGVECSQIVIEITESLFFEANNEIYANLDLFRDNGILIAIDDFGMKYSTLSVLEKVKYDMIKLDRHFTMNLGTKNADLIVNLVYELCEYNGKRCVVEGVEDKNQLEELKRRGFTEFQGYYYSKPLRESEVEKYYIKFFND